MAFPKKFQNEIMKQGEEDYANTPYENLTSSIECMRVEIQLLREDFIRSTEYGFNLRLKEISRLFEEVFSETFKEIKTMKVRKRVVSTFRKAMKDRRL